MLPLLSAPLGLVAVLLAATWTTAGGATRDGLPTPTTMRVLRHELAAARALLHGFHLPVAPRPGVQFLAALLVGLAGVACRLILVASPSRETGSPRRRSRGGRTGPAPLRLPLVAMLPAAALVTWSVDAVGGTGADLLAAGVAALGTAIVLADLPAPLRPLGTAHPVHPAESPAPRVATGDGHGSPRLRAGRSRARRVRRTAAGWALSLGSIGVALAVAALAGASGPPVPGSTRGTGPGGFGAIGAGPGSGQHPGNDTGTPTGLGADRVPPTALSLATDLVGLEAEDPTVPLFTAATPVPTYWQVATLTDFEAGRWSASAATLAALRAGSPSAEPTVLPAAGRVTFVARVTLDHFSSRLLPVPPDTMEVAVTGGAAVTETGAIAPSPVPGGTTYQTSSMVAPSVAAAPAGNATTGIAGAGGIGSGVGSGAGVVLGGGLLPTTEQAADLALPGLSPTVRRLAAQVTAGATTPLARAEALEDWFRSGRFRYRLPTPSTAAHTHPAVAMVRFLEVTRQGSCQDFAGAYAAMARAVGLPARVAVGFTAGRRLPPTTRAPAGFVTSVVQGTDAHAWPEVYLGAALGWVSFEPTPARPAGQLSPEGVVGPVGRTVPRTGPLTSTPTATTPRASTPPSTNPPTSKPPSTNPPSTNPTTGSSSSTGSHTAASGSLGSNTAGGLPAGAWVALGVTLCLLLALLAIVVVPFVLTGATLPTARRRGRLARDHPALAVLDAYRSAQRTLAPMGLAALPTDSPVRWVGELLAGAGLPLVAAAAGQPAGARPSDAERLMGALGDVLLLARALEQVCFASVPATSEQATDAYRRAARLRRVLHHRGIRRVARQLAARVDRPVGGAVDRPVDRPVGGPAGEAAQSPRAGRSTSPV